MSENEIIDNNIQEDEVRLYELGINLVATLEDKIKEEFEVVKAIIKNHGGEIKTESTPVTIPLAYTMYKNIDSKNIKYNTASFGWAKFTSTPDKIELIKEDLDLNAEILRYVILKTTEDADTDSNTIAEILSKKNEVTDDRRKRRGSDSEEEVSEVAEVEEAPVVATEEIDEAIETLVEETK